MIHGFRLDIWLLIWFIGMGMVNYMATNTDYFNSRVDGKLSIEEIGNLSGTRIGEENITGADYLEPHITTEEEEGGYNLLGTFGYLYKAGSFVTTTLWRSTFGFHTYLRDFFGIPVMPWGFPLMILINMVNFLGLIELLTKIKIL